MSLKFQHDTTNSGKIVDETFGFEYRITYPVTSNAVTAVVILLGWTGCRDKDLAKYSALYEKKGCITIRYIPAPKDVFISPGRFRMVAFTLLEIIEHMNLENPPLFFHMFSNGGCAVFRHMTKAICADTKRKFNVCGSVFDSAPAVISIPGVLSAMSKSLRGSFLYKLSFFIVFWIYIGIFVSIDLVVSVILNRPWEAFCIGIWQDLSSDKLKCPQLVLFSRADEICGYKSINKFVEKRKNFGVDVTSVCWNDSSHVGHFVTHPKMYTLHVYRFLNTCIKNNRNSWSG